MGEHFNMKTNSDLFVLVGIGKDFMIISYTTNVEF